MPKNPIGTQKVYVTLADFSEAQTQFNRLVSLSNDAVARDKAFRTNHPETRSISPNPYKAEARGMAKVIRILKLPIEIPNGF